MMLNEQWGNQQNKSNVKIVKFTADFATNQGTFERNAIFEMVDKSEQEHNGEFLYIYRIKDEDTIYTNIPEFTVVELEDSDLKNKDYTKSQWNKKITHDAMVDEMREDQNYVETWKETYGINQPVKDRADQTDYDSEWRLTKKRMERHYRTET